MKFAGIIVVTLLFLGCNKSKINIDEAYRNFYGKWNSINLENPIEFEFKEKEFSFNGVVDRNINLKITKVMKLSPPLRTLQIYTKNSKTVVIAYNITMDTIECIHNLDFQFSGNSEFVTTKMVKK